ncbi:6-hydroxy-D-nicotine oxidase [Achromobacter insolitus]|uniref:FAD-binding oxidoreductase n=1 Tax=Achromobacter insolitus TaxID=217204 RepID=UPI00146971C7|nr:FAD-binding oxidoreductase [Achromobacter insolitus]CAB3954850.1 6-hydroxy-D-nicotine oxidase [Achromobacter insolitus]
MSKLPANALDDLKASARGQVLGPEDAGYDDARKIWNAMIDRRPAVIFRCAGAADVRRAVDFARDNDLILSVRGGGHNIAGTAVCEGGMMLDLSPMKSVRVDPLRARAYVEPGATLADFDHEAQACGLATPLGVNSTTGVAGLTLGGGFGWLTRRFGMSIDNLLSADVVTADGQLLHASEQDNPELFWAIRGGGGNFGVVTMFEFQLHPIGPQVYGGLVVLPLEQGKEALRKYRDALAAMPLELTVWAVLRLAPPLPFLPEAVHGKPMVAFAMCYSGDPAQGPAAVEAVRGWGTPYGEHLGPMPYSAWQKAFDPLLTPGARNYWKSHNLGGLQDGLIDAIVEAVENLPSQQCEIFLGYIGGVASRVPVSATAYPHRSAQFAMNVHGRWDFPEEDERCMAWARTLFRTTEPYAQEGVYVNFLTQDEPERLGAAYGPNFDRLVQAKTRYDPKNLFRHNQNIRPAAA